MKQNMQNILNDNPYQVISNTLYDDSNLIRKADLNMQESSACLISHVLKWISDFQMHNKRDPYIVEILEYTAYIKESLSLSRKGKALEIFKKIMGREIVKKDKVDEKRGDE